MVDLSVYLSTYPATAEGSMAAWLAATSEANSLGVALLLPPGETTIYKTSQCSMIKGQNSILRVARPFEKAGIQGDYVIENDGYSLSGADRPAAKAVDYRDFSIIIEPTAAMAGIGISNAIGGSISGLSIYASTANLNDIRAVDSLIDFRATCQKIEVFDCTLSNKTGKHGSNALYEAGGGGCVWIRNMVTSFRGSSQNTTDGVDVHDCALAHCTSDEALAIYGAGGVVRNCSFRKSTVASTRDSGNPNGEPLHQTLLSIFPLSLGHAEAEVSGCLFDDLVIDDYGAAVGYILRTGLSNDSANRCFSNVISNCTVYNNSPTSIASVIANIECAFPPEMNNSENYAKSNIARNALPTQSMIYGFPRISGNRLFGGAASHYLGNGIWPESLSRSRDASGTLVFI